MKKICAIIGGRANYSSTRSIMKSIQATEGLELQVLLCAAALLERFGNLESILEEDGFEVDAKCHTIVEGETPLTMSKSTGLGIYELSSAFDRLKPDMVVAIGDRFDVMAAVIAATYMNIPIAHTMGGERSGTIDESNRHAITKFAHLHFPANEDSRQRIIRMGEDPDLVFNVGCPRIDYILDCVKDVDRNNPIDSEKLFEEYGVVGNFKIRERGFLLVSHHPVTTEYGSNRHHIEEILASLKELAMPTVMIWPNADAGSDEISKGIRVFRETEKPEWLRVFVNLPIKVYAQLMKLSACMIGNSSSAIREGEAIGVPAINVGTRQNMRLKGKNIMDVEPDRNAIVSAVQAQLKHGPYDPEFLYGDGHAGGKIAEIIRDVEIGSTQKINFY